MDCIMSPTPDWGRLSKLQLVMDVLSKLEGAYALLIKSVHYPGEVPGVLVGRRHVCWRIAPLLYGS